MGDSWSDFSFSHLIPLPDFKDNIVLTYQLIVKPELTNFRCIQSTDERMTERVCAKYPDYFVNCIKLDCLGLITLHLKPIGFHSTWSMCSLNVNENRILLPFPSPFSSLSSSPPPAFPFKLIFSLSTFLVVPCFDFFKIFNIVFCAGSFFKISILLYPKNTSPQTCLPFKVST